MDSIKKTKKIVCDKISQIKKNTDLLDENTKLKKEKFYIFFICKSLLAESISKLE